MFLHFDEKLCNCFFFLMLHKYTRNMLTLMLPIKTVYVWLTGSVCVLLLYPCSCGCDSDLCLHTNCLWFQWLRQTSSVQHFRFVSHRLMGSCSRTCSTITQQSSGYSSRRSSHRYSPERSSSPSNENPVIYSLPCSSQTCSPYVPLKKQVKLFI